MAATRPQTGIRVDQDGSPPRDRPGDLRPLWWDGFCQGRCQVLLRLPTDDHRVHVHGRPQAEKNRDTEGSLARIEELSASRAAVGLAEWLALVHSRTPAFSLCSLGLAPDRLV